MSTAERIPVLADHQMLADATVENVLKSLDCARVATVTAFSNVEGDRPRCTIELGHEIILRNNESYIVPPLEAVPVVYMQAAGLCMQWDLEVGDEVLAIITDRQLDIWLEAGGSVPPTVQRFHSMSDIVVLAGFPSTKNVPSVRPGGKTLYIGDVKDETAHIRVDVSAAGKITAEAAAIDLGSSATLGAARVTDPTNVSISPADPWNAWFQALAGFTSTTALLNTALANPISTVTTGSTKTRIE